MNQVDYEKTYPRYCRKCKGWGGFKSISLTVQIRDCEECIEKKRCPRCGDENFDMWKGCAICGWQHDDANRGLPDSKIN
ncbi:hypothetical protein [Burkholderia pseudomallei]|uniref:hypothetical protein n=1 Tax=Burkholderia pseudomallei TaxID=28450 RepID=UPI000536B973|nr:hypothetical protein [Burkholderia pseudomallei]KGV06398.1 hypothetical protein X895_1521 [Burkholderia pseudomallei MSHR4503]